MAEENSKTSPNNDHKCAICMDVLDKNHMFTPCIHGFHEDCIMPWLESKKQFKLIPCPICKRDISILLGPRDESYLYDNDEEDGTIDIEPLMAEFVGESPNRAYMRRGINRSSSVSLQDAFENMLADQKNNTFNTAAEVWISSLRNLTPTYRRIPASLGNQESTVRSSISDAFTTPNTRHIALPYTRPLERAIDQVFNDMHRPLFPFINNPQSPSNVFGNGRHLNRTHTTINPLDAVLQRAAENRNRKH
jgi:hypothetical protein